MQNKLPLPVELNSAPLYVEGEREREGPGGVISNTGDTQSCSSILNFYLGG